MALINVLRQRPMSRHVGVGVPVVGGTYVDQFDEADAAFRQPPGDETLPCEARVGAALEAVKLQGFIGFLRQIERLRRLLLHPVGRLK